MRYNQCHVLNGDSLLNQFPEMIKGQKIVMREFMVDGPVLAESIDDLYRVREGYIKKQYGLGEEEKYSDIFIFEMNKLLELEPSVDINLWFEDDLFCQVNLWFVLHYLSVNDINNDLYLVRPSNQFPYSFGHHFEKDLIESYLNKIKLENLKVWNSLFFDYQRNNFIELLVSSKELSTDFSQVELAVLAHIDRQVKGADLGRPKESIKAIIEEFDTKDFGEVFREFCKREAIYGFGDLTVKRLFDEVIESDF